MRLTEYSQVMVEFFGELQTDEVILTEERISHFRPHFQHLSDDEFYKLVEQIIPIILLNPDLITHDDKPYTAHLLKTEDGRYFRLVLRLASVFDPKGRKNSILTFFEISEKRYCRYMRREKIIYKRE